MLIALSDFLGLELREAVEAEALDGEAGDDGPVGEGLLDGGERDVHIRRVGCGEVAHHPAREAVAGAGRVGDLLDRVGGQDGHALVVHEHAPVLALLDNDKHRPHLGDDLLARADRVADAGEQVGFFIVDDQTVDLGEELAQLVGLGLDPEVHRVGDGEDALRQGPQELALNGGVAVGEEDELRVGVGLGHLGRVLAEDPELGEEGLSLVPVVEVLAAPGEGLGALADLEARDVDVVEPSEDGVVVVVEVLAGGGHEADAREEARCCCEVHRRPAQHPLALLEGCLDRIDADGSGDDEWHDALQVVPCAGAGFVGTPMIGGRAIVPRAGERRGYRGAMSNTPAVTRFAPSPTGDLHIGGARSALFCWALARSMGGRFLIRLEDTDQARSSDESARAILADLAWLGLDWDDGPAFEHAGATIGGDERSVGPYEQSKRIGLYNEHLKRLLDSGRAYPAFDSPEELAAMREAAQNEKRNFVYRAPEGYDRDEAMRRMEAGEPCVIRFAADQSKAHTVKDAVLGEVTFGPGELEDFVIRKADGFPTYHFAVVVDDALMGVTHILRGQEHLSNTPKHVALQEALGFDTPTYAHMPLIFNDRGAKMSKRERDQAARDAVKQAGAESVPAEAVDPDELAKWLKDKKRQLEPAQLEAVAEAVGVDLPEVSVKDFVEAGYLPEVIVNYIALLGWTPPKNEDGSEREHFDAAFLAQQFSVEKIGKSNTRFDRKKLLSFNMDFIAALETSAFIERFRAWAPLYAPEVKDVRAELLKAVHPQSKTLRDAADRCRFAVVAPLDYDEKATKKFLLKNEGEGLKGLRALREALAQQGDWSAEALHACAERVAEESGLGMGKVAQPVRIALTGAAVSPAIGPTLAALGEGEVLKRIDACLERMAAHAG